MKKIIYGCLIATLLGGCGLFGKDPLEIDGERVSVIREDKNLQPDFLAGQMKIKLPRAQINNDWSQTGGSSNHQGGHLKAGGNLDEVWSASFGDGSSKRNVLIAAPVAKNKTLFTIDVKGVVSAFNLDNGDEIWQRRLKAKNREARASSILGSGVAVYDDKLFAATGFGVLFAFNGCYGINIKISNYVYIDVNK